MNIKLKEIEVYHPNNKVSNEYYVEHFKKQGKEIRGFLEAFGRKERYICQEEENTLTLGFEVTKKILDKSNLKGEDIDLIVFTSQCPEYLWPSQALILHGLIKGNPKAQVLDINVNCVGMLVSLDTVARLMQSNDNIQRALIVGADCVSVACKDSDEYTYPMFGDAACAIILEKTMENRGFIDSEYRTNGQEWDIVTFPQVGFSKSYNVPEDMRQICWHPFNGTFIIEHMKDGLQSILERQKMDLSEIDNFCFSQYALPIIKESSIALDVNPDKFIYIGDQYGYTGTSSPFIALYEGIQTNLVKRGNLISLWSIGTNWTTCNVLLRY